MLFVAHAVWPRKMKASADQEAMAISATAASPALSFFINSATAKHGVGSYPGFVGLVAGCRGGGRTIQLGLGLHCSWTSV